MSTYFCLHNVSRNKKSAPGLLISPFGIQYMNLKDNKKPKVFDEISFVDGRDVSEVKEGLGILHKKHKIKKVNLVIPEFEFSTFFVTIYKDKKQKEKQLIADYIQKNIYLDPKDIAFDYDVVSDNKGVLVVSVVVISKERLNWYTDILKSFNIIPLRVISESISLAKALVLEKNDEPHVIVNVMPQYTTLSLVGDNVVYKSEFIDECLDITNIDRLSKKVNSFVLEWYSMIGRVAHDRTHHVVVNTYNEEITKKIISTLRNVLGHMEIRRGNSWINCFNLNEYIPSLHKKDLYRYASVIGASLFGKK